MCVAEWWGDSEVHVKFRILKCGKYTNFVMAMNVFSPTFWLCVRSVELSEAMGHSLGRTESERKIFWRCRLYRYPYHVISFKRRTNSKCADVVERTGTWLLWQIRFPKLFNSPMPHYFYFGSKWVLDPTFLEYFWFHVLIPDPFKNIGV